MNLAALAARLEERDGHLALDGAAGWMQGRTMYGGASSYLAYAAIRRRLPDLPVLRAAQIGFIAPVSEHASIAVQVLRAGRAVTQVQTDLFSDGALAHRAIWLFGAARESNGAVSPGRAEGMIALAAAEPIADGDPGYFTVQLERRRAEPRGGNHPARIRQWVRLRERAGLDAMGEIVAIADALPPGAIRAMARRGPISSINWGFTLLTDAPQTEDGWWLLETGSNGAGHGFSSETLRLWNAAGEAVAIGLQSVAVFG